MNRVKIWGTTPEGHIVEAHFSEELQGVLYINGEKGEEREVWLAHHSQIKNRKGKDIITIPYQERHNEKTGKGITTKTEEKKLRIPVEYRLEVKSIGERQYVQHRTGKMIEKRIHSIVNGEEICDDIWEALTEEQKKHLSHIDVWDVYDELVKWHEEGGKPSNYIGALQEIYNKTIFKYPEKYTKFEPEFIKVPTHKLVHCDITLTIQAGKYGETKHFTEGGIIECKGEIKRTFAFTLPRVKIFQANLPGKYKIIKENKRR